jgi:hypothetical protein
MMKRNMDLIRSLLLELEGEPVDLSEYSDEQLIYHKAMLKDAGLAHGGVALDGSGRPCAAELTHLSWQGHEFISASRNNTVWNKAMTTTREKGVSVTFTVLQSLLESIIKSSLGI